MRNCILGFLWCMGSGTKEISYTFPWNQLKSLEINQNHWKSGNHTWNLEIHCWNQVISKSRTKLVSHTTPLNQKERGVWWQCLQRVICTECPKMSQTMAKITWSAIYTCAANSVLLSSTLESDWTQQNLVAGTICCMHRHQTSLSSSLRGVACKTSAKYQTPRCQWSEWRPLPENCTKDFSLCSIRINPVIVNLHTSRTGHCYYPARMRKG